MLKLFTSMVAACLFIGVGAQTVIPDITYGVNGKVLTPVGNGNDAAAALVIQSDGKAVVCGNAYNGSNFDIALTRYNINGSLDNTFGTGGKVITVIGTATETANAIALQSDGKIVVTGYTYTGSNPDIAVVRYNSDGSLDNTFGTGGKVVTPIGSGLDMAYAIGVQSDGKIVVCGNTNANGTADFVVLRYTTNGVLDNTFGTGGKVLTAIGNGSDYAYSLVIQSDDKILAGGWSNNGSNIEFAIVRYATNGTLDNSFGSSGIVSASIAGKDTYGNALALQKDGKIIISGGSTSGANYDFSMMRFLNNGMVDATFGTSGNVVTSIGSGDDDPTAIAVQRDGKIILAGDTYNGTNYDFAMVRYNADGSIDNTFGTNGKITMAFGAGSDYINAIKLQADDKILVAGYSANGTNNDFALGRYTNKMSGINGNAELQQEWTIQNNPSQGLFTLVSSNMTSNNCCYSVYDTQGNCVLKSGNAAPQLTTIDLSAFPAGLYLLQINEETSSSKMFKLIKQ